MPTPSSNLKQRLAALSLAQSAPSSPHSPSFGQMRNGNGTDSYSNTPTSPTWSRKTFFHRPDWMKRPQGSSANHNGDSEYVYGDEEKRIVQEVLAKMIFQAGVDFETRPMVVLNASALPDPQVVSYDLLLARILSYLNLYVEADYTVVFFAAGSKHAPSWNWVWKAYRSLSRKYRKNLKQLYIVHSSFFSKMLFSLAGAIISPKFFRKLTYITTLSELAQHVPLTQIDIPPAVYRENLKHERKITLPVPTRSNIFGVPLEDLMGYNGEKGGIPGVVRDAIQFLRDSGMKDEGLFRRSPSSALLRAAQDAYDRGNVVSLETFADPHLAAVLLKKYLRDLPEPIFPEGIYGVIRRCPLPLGGTGTHRPGEGDEEAEMAAVRYVREVLLPELAPCAYILLSNVLHLLHDVSLRSDINRMDAFNLAIVICPNLVKSANPIRDVMMCNVPVPSLMTTDSGIPTMSAGSLSHSFTQEYGSAPNGTTEGKSTLGMVIALCIRRYYEIFDEVLDRSEAVAPWRAFRSHKIVGDGASSESGSASQPMYVLGDGEDEEDFDDEVLVMPIGMEGHHQHQHHQRAHAPPRTRSATMSAHAQQLPGTKRHRNTLSNGSNAASTSARSMFDTSSGSPSAWNVGRSSTTAGTAYQTIGKARSTISIERGSGGGDGPFSNSTTRTGSITIGRGTTRKGSGAAVEVVGVTAEGFFSPPSGSVPPVPKLPSRHANEGGKGQEEGQDAEEERVLSVGERRRMFEGGT